jgi:hypothetical protein
VSFILVLGAGFGAFCTFGALILLPPHTAYTSEFEAYAPVTIAVGVAAGVVVWVIAAAVVFRDNNPRRRDRDPTPTELTSGTASRAHGGPTRGSPPTRWPCCGPPAADPRLRILE